MQETRTIRLVTGNSSWWKARKYRRETAATLLDWRARGWRLTAIRRLPRVGVDTRVFSEYRLMRRSTRP